MLCKICMLPMESGTKYYPKNNNKDKGYKRFYKCRKCNKKIFTEEPNFQEHMNEVLQKNINK